jgi:hypothetical protein
VIKVTRGDGLGGGTASSQGEEAEGRNPQKCRNPATAPDGFDIVPDSEGTGSVAEPPSQGGASALGAMGVAEGGPTWGRSEAPPHSGDRPGILSTHVPLLQGGSASGKKRADESERWASMCINVCVSTNIFVSPRLLKS